MDKIINKIAEELNVKNTQLMKEIQFHLSHVTEKKLQVD